MTSYLIVEYHNTYNYKNHLMYINIFRLLFSLYNKMSEADRKLLSGSMPYITNDGEMYSDDILGLFRRLPDCVQHAIYERTVKEMVSDIDSKKAQRRVINHAQKEFNKIQERRDKMRQKLELLREAKLLDSFKPVDSDKPAIIAETVERTIGGQE